MLAGRPVFHGLVHTLIPIPKAMKLPAAKAAGGKEGDKLKIWRFGANRKFVPKQASASQMTVAEALDTVSLLLVGFPDDLL